MREQNSHRRKMYLLIGLILLIMAPLFGVANDITWLVIYAIPLLCLYIYDITQKKHSLLRNFPILGHLRYIMEFFRPEIQQYWVASDEDEKPYNREVRDVIYQRAKGVNDTNPFGTQRDILAPNYEWILHSIAPLPPKEVESRVLIGGPDCKQPYLASRLNISAMSYGAISPNAILALNNGAKIGNFAQNTGEGGLSDYHLAGGGDLFWQLGTANFGCRDEHGNFNPDQFKQKAVLKQVKMIEVKMSQGAKPGHGGVLPAAKITPEIARIRGIKMGKDCLSPACNSECKTPKDLLNFIKKLRDLSGGKPVGFKLCIGRKGQFVNICKAMLETKIYPDFITVDGAEGGTGAAPLEYSNHVGMPLNDGLIFVHNCLVGHDLRKYIKVIASGKVATGFDMVSKIALGADTCNVARPMMMAAGCIQSRQCNVNSCPTGVATTNPKLYNGLDVNNKKIRVAQYHHATLHSFRELIGSMGISNPALLNPSHLVRRLAYGNIQTYAQIYEYLQPGDLLKKVVPASFAAYCEKTSADTY